MSLSSLNEIHLYLLGLSTVSIIPYNKTIVLKMIEQLYSPTPYENSLRKSSKAISFFVSCSTLVLQVEGVTDNKALLSTELLNCNQELISISTTQGKED